MQAELVVAIGKDSDDLVGHVWVTVDGRPLYDDPAKLTGFVPMLVFDSSGAAVEQD